ncbi:hypothetical protein EON65_24705 [archaeon]|nr:MAG: hypothetical protein EON65_24705 [archaeon]
MLRTSLYRGIPRSLFHASTRLSSSQHDLGWICEKTIQIPNSTTELGVCKFRMGHLSESSVLGKAGNTMVHVALNSKTPDAEPKEDFLPLTVDYRSRSYAFGILPPLPKRRERHGDDEEILAARVIDRAIRPLFPKGYTDEVQLTVTAHAIDNINDPTILAVNAASAALYNSKQPWNGPIGCVRIGYIDGNLTVNPPLADMKRSTLDLLYAGTSERTLM